MGPQELELAILASADSPDRIQELLELGVTESSFAFDEHGEVWTKLVMAKEIPTRADIKLLHGVDLPEERHNDLSGMVETLNARATARRVRNAIAAGLPHLDVDPGATAIKLVNDLSEAVVKGGKNARFADRDAMQRFEELKQRIERVGRGEFAGIPTGLPVFDEQGEFWKPGDMVAIIGVTSAGKSSLMLSFAVTAYLHDYKVLWLSPENTREEVELKWDPMVGRSMGYTFSNRGLRLGLDVNMPEYEEYVKKVSSKANWVTKDSGEAGVFTVEDIVALSREYKPDVLCVDGFHLLRGMGKSWETMKEGAETIKGLAQSTGMVTFTTCQAGAGGREAYRLVDTAPEIYHVSYGQALGDASDRVIAIGARRGEQAVRFINVRKNRGGAVPTNRIYLQFDIDHGVVEQHMVEETTW